MPAFGRRRTSALIALERYELAVLVERKDGCYIRGQAIADVFFQPITGKSLIMRGVLGFHELIEVLFGLHVNRLGYLRGVAVDMEVLFDLIDDGSGK